MLKEFQDTLVEVIWLKKKKTENVYFFNAGLTP